MRLIVCIYFYVNETKMLFIVRYKFWNHPDINYNVLTFWHVPIIILIYNQTCTKLWLLKNTFATFENKWNTCRHEWTKSTVKKLISQLKYFGWFYQYLINLSSSCPSLLNTETCVALNLYLKFMLELKVWSWED